MGQSKIWLSSPHMGTEELKNVQEAFATNWVAPAGPFINQFEKPFWLINTARGKSVVTKDLVIALQSGKIIGAGLDVLEYEKSSFENLFSSEMPAAFKYLIQAQNVILTPHVAGWTVESNEKLAQTIVDKIKAKFC